MQIWSATILSISILLSNSLKLRAATAGPVPEDGDGQWSQMCPMCCQGQSGIPGIPGLPGQLGGPGVKGEKGEIGPIGTVGERGAPGNPGSKGDEGLGLPGKMGPMGPPGLVGSTGAPGVKGHKGGMGPVGPIGAQGPPGSTGPKGDDGIGLPGETGPRGPPGSEGRAGAIGSKGQKGERGDSAHRVAFTVTRISPSAISSNSDTHLPFDQTETLLPGTVFDLETGTFTCTVPGTYFFTFSVLRPSRFRESVRVHLKKNAYGVVSGESHETIGGGNQVSASAVLLLQQGDSVYLTYHGQAYGWRTTHFSSFSGFLLYAH
ncbi:complement C1q and tumor necrosis factor-related protein 9-like [Acanthaster planci]|uniref:Complement C1q and tumor necrosis factor-related protein 9-like n=1 Tax=Acanthaster planci TaxID=133434 RepID=A0A8B7ZYS0_ACAPL|nr:complement C1q and tumor necrosis factor-related protein 9-like [Acanthaster planci]